MPLHFLFLVDSTRYPMSLSTLDHTLGFACWHLLHVLVRYDQSLILILSLIWPAKFIHLIQ
jgi:hypothetical protein